MTEQSNTILKEENDQFDELLELYDFNPLPDQHNINLNTDEIDQLIESTEISTEQIAESQPIESTPSQPKRSPANTDAVTSENPNPRDSIGIFALPKCVNEENLHEIFKPFGEIVSVKLIRNHKSKNSLGYAFIKYENAECAKRAIESANGMEINNKKIRVEYCITENGHVKTPGKYLGKLKQNNKKFIKKTTKTKKSNKFNKNDQEKQYRNTRPYISHRQNPDRNPERNMTRLDQRSRCHDDRRHDDYYRGYSGGSVERSRREDRDIYRKDYHNSRSNQYRSFAHKSRSGCHDDYYRKDSGRSVEKSQHRDKTVYRDDYHTKRSSQYESYTRRSRSRSRSPVERNRNYQSNKSSRRHH